MFGNSKIYPNTDSSSISKRIKVFINLILWLLQTICYIHFIYTLFFRFISMTSDKTEIIGAEMSCKIFDLSKIYKQDDREMNFDIFYKLKTEATNHAKWNQLHLDENHEVVLSIR